jgi:hypothetical protein
LCDKAAEFLFEGSQGGAYFYGKGIAEFHGLVKSLSLIYRITDSWNESRNRTDLICQSVPLEANTQLQLTTSEIMRSVLQRIPYMTVVVFL